MARSVRLFQRPSSPTSDELTGPARIGRRTKALIERLRHGDVAVIDHVDLDRIAADSLVEAGVVAVLNAAPSCSGRYPNEGPLVLLRAGVVLIDGIGPQLMELIAEGDTVTVLDDVVMIRRVPIVSGVRQSVESIEAIHASSQAGLAHEFARFLENTAEYLETNRDLVTTDLVLPDLGVDMAGRHALVVVRGSDHREDLALIKGSGYIRELRPVLIGVDGGADALLDAGLKPHIIVGDFDSVSEKALRCGATLICHAYPDGEAPGAARLDALGLAHHQVRASGTSEDLALLLAHQSGSDLLVAVGTHTSMVDFLDKGRKGMASTLVTRMKVGSILVDAKGVSRLYQTNVRKRDLLVLVLAAVVALVAVMAVSEPVQLIIRALWTDLTN